MISSTTYNGYQSNFILLMLSNEAASKQAHLLQLLRLLIELRCGVPLPLQ